jgi:hypothetical protein
MGNPTHDWATLDPRIDALKAQGLTHIAIARALGITRTALISHLHTCVLGAPVPPCSYTDDEIYQARLNKADRIIEDIGRAFPSPPSHTGADLCEELSAVRDALRYKTPGTEFDRMMLEEIEKALERFSRLDLYDGRAVHPEEAPMVELSEAFQKQMRLIIALLLYERTPEISYWFTYHLGGFVAVETLRRIKRGRPENSGRFTDAHDFRQTVVSDLRRLRQQGEPDTR